MATHLFNDRHDFRQCQSDTAMRFRNRNRGPAQCRHFGPDIGIITQIAVQKLADSVDWRLVPAKARGHIKQLDLFFAISQAD